MSEADLSVWRLLALLRLGPARRAWSRLDGPGALRLAVFAGMGLGFEAVLYGVFRALGRVLWSQPVLGPLLGARVLGLGLDLLFALLLLTTLPAFFGRLLGADDAEFFAAGPLDPRAYFSLRLAEAGLGAAWVLPLFWVPGAFALRRVLGAGLGFTLWTLLAPLPLAVLAVALGAGCLCLLLKALPPARLRRGLGLAAGLAFAAFMLALLLSHPERLSDPQHARTMEAYLAGLQALDSPWWPGTWATRAVLWGPSAPFAALGVWLAFAAVGAGAWLGVIRLFGADAFNLWQKGRDSVSRRGRGGHGAFRSSSARAPWRVLLEQGAVALARAPGQLAQALLLAGLLVLFVVSVGRLPLGNDQQLKDWIFLPVCCVAQSLLAAVAARFVYPAHSLDRGARWLLAQSPAAPRDQVLSQALLGGALLLPLAAFLAWTVERALTPAPVLAASAWACFLAVALGLACLHAGLGAAWASPADHAEEALASASGVLAVVFSLLLILGTNALLAPLLRHEYVRRFMPARSWGLPMLGLGLALGLNVCAATLGWNAGVKRMDEGG